MSWFVAIEVSSFHTWRSSVSTAGLEEPGLWSLAAGEREQRQKTEEQPADLHCVITVLYLYTPLMNIKSTQEAHEKPLALLILHRSSTNWRMWWRSTQTSVSKWILDSTRASSWVEITITLLQAPHDATSSLGETAPPPSTPSPSRLTATLGFFTT